MSHCRWYFIDMELGRHNLEDDIKNIDRPFSKSWIWNTSLYSKQGNDSPRLKARK